MSSLPRRGKLIFGQVTAADGSCASSIKALKSIIAKKKDEGATTIPRLGGTEKKRKTDAKGPVPSCAPPSFSSKKVKTDNHGDDEDELTQGDKARSILEIKAGLYEQMQRGDVPKLSGDAFLVDFVNKKDFVESSGDVIRAENDRNVSIDSSDMVEIDDEFGRTKLVSRLSKEYKAFLLAREVNEKRNQILSRHHAYQQGSPQYESGSISNGLDNKQWRWSKGEAREPARYNPHEDGQLATSMAYQKILSDKVDSEKKRSRSTHDKVDVGRSSESKRPSRGIIFKQTTRLQIHRPFHNLSSAWLHDCTRSKDRALATMFTSRLESHETSARKLQETRLLLPCSFDDVKVLDFGHITSVSSFHNIVQLYPIGYVAERTIVSTKKYGFKKVTMTDVVQMEIKSVDNDPEFTLTNLISGKSFSSFSESSAWKKFDAYHDLGENGKVFYSFFNLEVELLIEGMDGAAQCSEYKFHVERGYGYEYSHGSELFVVKSKYLQVHDREKRNKLRELGRSMSFEEKKLMEEQTNKKNAQEKELDKELKNIQAEAARFRQREEKELAKQQKELEHSAHKDAKEDAKRRKGDSKSRGKKGDDDQGKERQALESMKKDKSFKEVNMMLGRIKTDAYSKLLQCFDKEEEEVEDREKLVAASSMLYNSQHNNSMMLSQFIEQCTLSCSSVFGTEDVEALSHPIDWTNVIQVANYLRIFKQTLSIMGTADVDIDALISHMKALSTITESSFLTTHSDCSNTQSVSDATDAPMDVVDGASERETGENGESGGNEIFDIIAHGDLETNNIATSTVDENNEEIMNEDGVTEDNGTEKITGDDQDTSVGDFSKQNVRKNNSSHLFETTPLSAYDRLQKSISNIDRIHLNLVRAFSSEFPVTAGGGVVEESEALLDGEKPRGASKKSVTVQPRLPINQMTWTEIARMSIISVLMIELGRRRDEVKYVVCGSKFHVYRSANSIVRSVRYRLSVQTKIESTKCAPQAPAVDLFDSIAKHGKSTYNQLLFLDALDQGKDSLSARLLMRSSHDTPPPQPLAFESENDVISQLQEILRDSNFDLYSEVYHRCCKVFLRLFATSQAKNFLWEVDSGLYPDYYSTVRRPIMLVNVATSLITRSYSTTDRDMIGDEWESVAHGFYNDMMQIFINCFVYNTEETVLPAQAYKFVRVLHRHCQRWLLAAHAELPPLDFCDESHCLLTLRSIPPAVRSTERADARCETCGGHFLASAVAEEYYKKQDELEQQPTSEHYRSGSDLYPYLFLPPGDIKEDWLCPFCLKEGTSKFRHRIEMASPQHFFLNEWGPSTHVPWLCNGQFSADWQDRYDKSMSIRLLFDALRVLNSPSKASTTYPGSTSNESDAVFALPWTLEERFTVLLALCEVMMNHSSCSEELGLIQKECGKLMGLIDKSNFRKWEFIDVVRNICGERGAEQCRRLLDGKDFEDVPKEDAVGTTEMQVVEGQCLVCGSSTFEEDCDLEVILCDGCNGDVHLVCLNMKEVPKNDWFCSPCQARKSSSKDVLYDKKFPIDDYRTYSEESRMVDILADERSRCAGMPVDELVAELAEGEALCHYCGMPELALCSPFVCGQTRDEHEAHIDANKLILLAKGYIKDKPVTTVKLFMDGYQLEPPPLSIPYFPLIGSKNADDMLEAHNGTSGIFERVVVHELCALKMFRARMSRKKHGLRRERLQVANKAIMMSGVTTQALGKDDYGREYWRFVCSDNLFMRVGASEEAEKLSLKRMMQSNSHNDYKPPLFTASSAGWATWRVVKSYSDIQTIIDLLGFSKNERHLRKVLCLEFPPDKKREGSTTSVVEDDRAEDDTKDEEAAKDDAPLSVTARERLKRDVSYGEGGYHSRRESAPVDPNLPTTLTLIAAKGSSVAKTYVIREETAFEDVPEEPSAEYMEFSKKYYAIAIFGPTGRKLNLAKTASVRYQLHYDGFPHAIVDTLVEEPFRESIYYFAVPSYKKAGTYSLTFRAEGDVVAKVEPLTFKVSVSSEIVRGGLPNGLNQLRALQFVHDRNRQFTGRRISPFVSDPTYNREIVAVKTAMRGFYYALPQGSVYMAADEVNPRNNREKDFYHTLAQGMGWSDELDQLWVTEVEKADDARTLMELMIMLEHSINEKWYYTDIKPGAYLQAAHYAIRCASYSSIALRIFILDKAIDYKKFVVPQRAQRGGGVTKRIDSDSHPAYTTVTTASGRKSKALLNNFSGLDYHGGGVTNDVYSDEPKRRGRPRKSLPADDNADFHTRPEGLRARSHASYAEDEDEDVYNAAEAESAVEVAPHHSDEKLNIFDRTKIELIETLSAGKADFGLQDDDDTRAHFEADSISNLCILDLSIRCLNILHRIFNDQRSYAFWYPVSDDIVPGYSAVIACPMDLGTVTTKVKEMAYGKDYAGFVSDVMLVFDNCFKFNHKTSYFYKSAKSLMAIFVKDLEANIISRNRPGNPSLYIM